jgi:hypothetical protein
VIADQLPKRYYCTCILHVLDQAFTRLQALPVFLHVGFDVATT